MGFLSRFRTPSADDPPPTESCPLFAFGKLPVYKDFISANLTDDASREFRDWLSNGFSRVWSARDDCRSAEIPLHAFLLGLPESRKVAVGALWGSADQGGLRKFPFALFTILPAGKPAASVLAALDYLSVFETRARDLRRRYDAGGSLAAVYQELRGKRIDIPVRTPAQIRARLAEALARRRIGPLATSLFEDDAPPRWAALLAGLDAAARRPTAGAAAFRIPLADEPSPADQMKLWALRLTRPGGAVPTGVCYRLGGSAPRGVIFFRDARPEDILLFHPDAISTDFVEEIPPPGRRTAAEPADAAPEPPAESAPAEPRPPEPASAEPAAAEPPAPPAPAESPAAELPPAPPAPTESPAAEPPLTGTAQTEPAPAEPSRTEPPPPEPPPSSGTPQVEPAPIEPAPAVPTSPEPAPPAETTPPAAPPEALPPPMAGIVRLGAAAAVSERPPVPERPAAAAPTPAPPPPAPAPRAEPAGWDLPLASLLDGG